MSTPEQQGNLITEVTCELDDPAWLNRTHGIIGTYNSGCRGPLCQKANRDYARAKYAARARRAGAVVDNHVKLRAERDHDALLEMLQEHHLQTRYPHLRVVESA